MKKFHTPLEEIAAGRLDLLRPKSHIIDLILSEMIGGLLLAAGLPAGKYRKLALERYGSEGIDLIQAAKEILGLVGLPDPSNTPGRIRAAFSGATGAAVLESTAAAALMVGYNSSADTTTGWITTTEISDFRENRRLRASSGRLEILPRDGEAEHLAPVLSQEVYHADRFGRQFTVDEVDLVDNGVAMLVQQATAIGRMAASLKGDLVFSELMANGNLSDGNALFSSAHANLSTTAALAAATLDNAIKAMNEQRENDMPASTDAKYLLVPPALLGLARRLVRDMTSDEAPLKVFCEPRLGAGVIDPRNGTSYSGSDTTWYLASAGCPCIEFGARTREPELASWHLGPGAWGVGFSVSWDVGSKALDYRGLHKATA